MATHSNILTWRISQTEEPGGLQYTGSKRVRHDWSDYTCTHALLNSRTHVLHLSWSVTSNSDYFQYHEFSSPRLGGKNLRSQPGEGLQICSVVVEFSLSSLPVLESIASGCGCPGSQYFKPQEWHKRIVINKAWMWGKPHKNMNNFFYYKICFFPCLKNISVKEIWFC